MISIVNYKYGNECIPALGQWFYGKDWPSVYIAYNDKKAYVGETLDAVRRTEQHLQEEEFKQFTDICFISDNTFNKSVILDLESFLIKYMSAEGTKELTNGNAGIVDHSYFYKEMYAEEFKEIWSLLIDKGIVNRSLRDIENSELYKYSPYKSLNREQLDASYRILSDIAGIRPGDKRSMIQVIGGAGTGKTILAVYLIKLLSDIVNERKFIYDLDVEDSLLVKGIAKNLLDYKKIGFVVPMNQLRETIKKIFASIDGLNEKMVLSPEEATEGYYDLLVCDEAHRLYKRYNLPSSGSGDNNATKKFDAINKRLMGDHFTGTVNDYTELDWIIKRSKAQVLFYDNLQSIRHTDIDPDRFNSICAPILCKRIELTSQMRCKGGTGYYEYVKSVLEDANLSGYDFKKIENYDVKVIDSIDDFVGTMVALDAEKDLCKIVAGPAWSSSKPFMIDGHEFKWADRSKASTIGQDDKTIWSIHKIQGFDLNYCGVVFGKEVFFDTKKNRVDVKRNEVQDKRVTPRGDDEKMRRFILNIYLTLMTRGIYGTYIYAVDENLREYFKKFFR